MKKEVLWKRALWAVVLFLLCALLLAEFGGMVLFVAGVFGLSALWVLGRAWWEARRERLRREEAETAFRDQGYGVFKPAVGDAVIELFRPIREEAQRLMADKAYLEGLYRQGAERASRIAGRTLAKVYKKVGFLPR